MSPAISVVIFLLVAVVSYLLYLQFKPMPVNTIALTSGNFEHIQFSRKTPNSYRYQDDVLVIDVNNSASFLMQAFGKVKHVEAVSFEWQSKGRPAIESIEQEKQRSGDDAIFKLGLLIETREAPDEFFLPAWMRRVDALLKFPSEKMFFLVAGAKHAAGQIWAGPYNRRMTMIAMSESELDQGWHAARYQFSEPVRVVAIWLMADGDDTHSAFTVSVRDIRLVEKTRESTD